MAKSTNSSFLNGKNMKVALAAALSAYAGIELDKRHALSHDLTVARKMAGFGSKLRRLVSKGKVTADVWEKIVKDRPNQNAIVFIQDNGMAQPWTYGEVDRFANQVGNFLLSQGVKPNDDVALFMENRAEYIGIWLGITKIGAKVTLVNTAIKEKGLLHSFQVTKCSVIIYGAELAEPFENIRSQLGPNIKYWSLGEKIENSLDVLLQGVSTKQPSKELRKNVKPSDTYGYIFTSGTTGLPKASIIAHVKLLTSIGIPTMLGVQPGVDVVYTCLPLFHSAAGLIGCSFLLNGLTMVLRRKFSARQFFEDCANNNVTIIQYIGELCRYLLASPPSDFDRAHKVRLAIGNGLRPEIWKEFQDRFNIPEILEFYGATEMNGLLYNHCKGPESIGCVGRLGSLGRLATGTHIVQYSVENDELIRNEKGFCIECKPGEVGQLVILNRNNELTRFKGYSDAKATEKKIARNVFKKGDEYFLSGDLLSRDEKGYYRFVDRIGDTFRWKGENCSTMEVSEVVSSFPGILEANVYGVLIPNNADGRAPCAAISMEDPSKLDFNKLLAHMKKNLPPYAVPLFLRITPKIDVTATFKHQKVELRNQGIDISVIDDPIYYLQDGKEYVPLDKQVYAKVCAPFAKL